MGSSGGRCPRSSLGRSSPPQFRSVRQTRSCWASGLSLRIGGDGLPTRPLSAISHVTRAAGPLTQLSAPTRLLAASGPLARTPRSDAGFWTRAVRRRRAPSWKVLRPAWCSAATALSVRPCRVISFCTVLCRLRSPSRTPRHQDEGSLAAAAFSDSENHVVTH